MKATVYYALGTLTVLGGYVAGCLTVIFSGENGTEYVARYLSQSASLSWGRAFAAGPLYLLILLFCGLFFFGWLCVYPLIGYKAYGYGYTAGLFLSAMGYRGLLPLGLCLFPSAVAECALLVRASREAFPQSFALFSGLRDGGDVFFSGLRGYLLRGLVLFQCSSFLLLWDLFLAPAILNGLRQML